MGANSDSNPALAQTDGGELEKITITSGSRPLQAVQKTVEHNPDVSNTGQCGRIKPDMVTECVQEQEE